MKIVVITGASRGIGRALVERFLENGDFIIGTSTTGVLPITHDRLLGVQLDLANPESIVRCTDAIEKIGKKIDILINNAGIWSGVEGDPIMRQNFLRKVMEVNLFGTVDFTEHVIPLMQDHGHIVNISSRQGSLTYVHEIDCPDYRISKAALNMATRLFAMRLDGTVTVSSVHPGWVKTDMGGANADLTPEESAEDIFTLANSQVETGQFWFKGEKFPW